MAMSDAQRARAYRQRKAAQRSVTVETVHSRKIVSGLTAERDLTVSEHELVRQIGQVIAELEELDRILRHRTTDWLQAAIEEVEEYAGPGVSVVLNPDPMLAAVDRKRALLKGLIAELRQHAVMAAKLPAGQSTPPAAATPIRPAAASSGPVVAAGPVSDDDDFDLFGAS